MKGEIDKIIAEATQLGKDIWQLVTGNIGLTAAVSIPIFFICELVLAYHHDEPSTSIDGVFVILTIAVVVANSMVLMTGFKKAICPYIENLRPIRWYLLSVLGYLFFGVVPALMISAAGILLPTHTLLAWAVIAGASVITFVAICGLEMAMLLTNEGSKAMVTVKPKQD